MSQRNELKRSFLLYIIVHSHGVTLSRMEGNQRFNLPKNNKHYTKNINNIISLYFFLQNDIDLFGDSIIKSIINL